MSTKFTPGPWLVDEVLDRRGNHCAYSVWPSHERQGPRNRIVSTPDGVTAEAKANAHLIAAAPEMYEVIEEIAGMKITDCDAHDAANYMRDAARALLAKMRGEA